MTKQNEQKKIYFSIAFLVAAIVLLLWLAIYPLLWDIKSISGEIFQTRKQIAMFSTKQKQSSNLRQSLAMFDSDIKTIHNLFINPQAPIDFLTFLERIAQKSNVGIAVTFQSKEKSAPKTPKTDFENIGIQISFSGSFSDCLELVDRLESSHYLIKIESINIKRIDEEKLKSKKYADFSAGNAEGNLSIKVFYQ